MQAGAPTAAWFPDHTLLSQSGFRLESHRSFGNGIYDSVEG